MTEFFNVVLLYPIINMLLVIYHALSALHIPYALGFSIIALTVVIRLALSPLIHSQLKASKKMQDLSPHLSKVKEKHKGDAQRVQQETMKLYKEHGVNPAAGCLPVLIQLPLIWALYGVLQTVITESPEKLTAYIEKAAYFDTLKLTQAWDTSFFGIPLGGHPANLMNNMPLIALIPLITGIFQFMQAKMMMPLVVKDKKEKLPKPKSDDFATAFQTQSQYIFPVMIAFFSYTLPAGLSLYWNTFTIFGILQQYKISGWGGLTSWKEKLVK